MFDAVILRRSTSGLGLARIAVGIVSDSSANLFPPKGMPLEWSKSLRVLQHTEERAVSDFFDRQIDVLRFVAKKPGR